MKDNVFSAILPPGQNSLSVRCIAEDNEGNLWIGTNNDGVYIYKDSVLQKMESDEFKMQNIMDILVDEKGNVWVATNGNGLLKYSGGIVKKYSVADGLPHDTINKLFAGADGKIYGGSANGIFIIAQDGNIEKINKLQHHEINDLVIDDYKNIWIASEQGLYRYELESQKLDSLTESKGLPGSQVSSLHFDHENSLWVATKKAGLLRFKDVFFENYTAYDGLSSNNVNIIVPHENSLYVGCDDGVINVISDGQVRKFQQASLNRKQGIRDILFDEKGDIYYASYHGLSRIRNGVEITYDFTKYGSSNDIRRIWKSKSGDLWLATRSGGAIKYSSENVVTVYNSKNGLKSDYILAIEEGSNGEIYIGTHSGGLSIILPNGQISDYPIEEGKSGILIFNIEVQSDNTLLAATNVGLYKFDNQAFKRIYIDEKINVEAFFDLVTDQDYAWLSTNTGLLRLMKTDIEKKLPGRD
ncbi:MAG: two-component regulator propeller domain-containing protein [Cyclobacteriaceae bacterium]|nr:two-component regulator propeller domain-containing protein [Cyclobacteriaceae bacterium]